MNENVISRAMAEKLIVIVRGVGKEHLIPLGEAMYRGGIRLMEITYSADGKVSDKETAARIAMLREHFDGRMDIGAGTVLTEKQVAMTKAAGGTFIVSPDANPAVIGRTKSEGLMSVPGALTPTEIAAAHRYGADVVKLFPAKLFGAPYVRMVKAPLSHVPLFAVGNMVLSDMKEYLDAGIGGFCVGGDIANLRYIAEGNFDAIEKTAAAYTSFLHKC